MPAQQVFDWGGGEAKGERVSVSQLGGSGVTGNAFINNKRIVQFHTFSTVSTVQKVIIVVLS